MSNDVIYLRELFNLDARYNGYEVVSVTAHVRNLDYFDSLELLIDGDVVDRSYTSSDYVTLYPGWKDVLGQELHTLQLRVNGQAYVDYISITIREGYWGSPETITVPISVNQRLYGLNYLDLSRYINLNNYYGYRIHSVDLYAQSIGQQAIVDLMVDNMQQGVGAVIYPYARSTYLFPQAGNDVIGVNAYSLALRTSGDLEIHEVVLRLSRRY